jgi:hypothetical protein
VSSPPDAVEGGVTEYTEEPLCSQLPFNDEESEGDETPKRQQSKDEEQQEKQSIPTNPDEKAKEEKPTLKRPTESRPLRYGDDYLLRRLRRSTKMEDSKGND